MTVEGIPGPARSVQAGASPRPAGARPDAEAFAAELARLLGEPRSAIASVRSEVASLRDGGALRRAPGAHGAPAASPAPSSGSQDSTWLLPSGGGGVDPHGWRAMTRAIGEQVIGPGHGALFERQIDQESGFAPDVVYGLRRSSAGAEGIAQLMPQFYPHVQRSDPRAALLAGAQSMYEYLDVWRGDVGKALASYNAGLGRVRAAVATHGEAWETALPQETRSYLAAILGAERPSSEPRPVP
ncbi:MAG: lytic transglycosylase domain-containing protein [Dehalococcoidia bacterium]